MNKNDNSYDDYYYDQFNFLKNTETKQDKNLKKNEFKGQRIKGAMTVDQLKTQNLEIASGVKSVMEEEIQSNVGDSLIMRKSDGQKMIESPELSKKIRTQIDYREAMKGNQSAKKTIQDEITFNQSNVDFLLTKEEKNKLLYKEMKKTHLEKVDNNQEFHSNSSFKEIIQDKEKADLQNFDKVDTSRSANSNDSKLKVYRVKKKKIVPEENKEQIQESTAEKKIQLQEIPKTEINSINSNSIIKYRQITPYLYASSFFILGSLFILNLFKKFKK